MNYQQTIEEAKRLCRDNQPQQALLILDTARMQHNHPAILIEMACVLNFLKMPDGAEQVLEQGMRLFEHDTGMVIAYANHAYQTNRPEKGLARTRALVKSSACSIELLLTHAHLLKADGQFSSAKAVYENVLAMDAKNTIALSSIGGLYLDERDYENAITFFQNTLTIDSDNTHIRTQLAYAYFRSGDLRNGWQAYNARFGNSAMPGIVIRRPFTQTLWDGKPISTGKLLIWCEQAAGEELLYSSMFHDVHDVCDNVVVECDGRLKPLFERSFKKIEFIARQDPPHALLMDTSITAQCPAGHIGQYVRNQFADFPQQKTYIHAEPVKTSRLRAQYQDLKNQHGKTGKVIGVSWKSKPLRQGDPKSSSIQDWAAIFDHSPHIFISLQHGETDHDLRDARQHGWMLFDDPCVNQRQSLDDFAAQICAVDAVVTVSNTTAHMAGACGIPTAVLLPYSRGLMWHWFDKPTLNASDRLSSSPWYPSVTLIRQSTDGAWDDVIAQASQYLAKL